MTYAHYAYVILMYVNHVDLIMWRK